MYSITKESNQGHLEEYALSTCVYECSIANNAGPKQDDIDKMGRRHLIPQGIAAIAAYEVILCMTRNLKTKIEFADGNFCRLLSDDDIFLIVKQAMSLLKTVFEPYSERLNKLSASDLREIGRRIAGVYHREKVVNIVTGSGISFTGVCKLYYDCAYLNKLETSKLLFGFSKENTRTIYYIDRTFPNLSLLHPDFPHIGKIESIVAEVMGPSA